ncbi:MAG: ATP-binding cassette domain-containing protein [Spirochaetales bacterium]|uniref:ATP-binding cassette domain-containing protein n=1 Tax=Candidatus Thalassospirochaeta sargassi TaxID=3119039 RepID=A0AAJ1IDF5_9SPIO|nr:ATP-binding cassette domain-containing protein [Spirochaetales bacterium]
MSSMNIASSAGSARSFIEIDSLEKTFHARGAGARGKGGFKAVDNVSLDIERNSIFGLVGESGCGKTTLSRAVLFLDPPTGGEIRIDGIDMRTLSASRLRTFRKRIQIVFQDPNSSLNPKMSIENSIKEGLNNIKYAAGEPERRAKLDNRVDELLALVGITPGHKTRFPHEFSGGQKQRIVIARALSVEPDFLILDEPVSNLDVSIQAQIINLLLELKEKLSLTYLFISHDLNLVSYLSDKIAVMYKGQIVESGNTERIMAEPVHPYTKKLFSAIPGVTRIDEEQELVFHVDEPGYSEGLPEGYCFYPSELAEGEAQASPQMLEINDGHSVACFEA